MRSNEPDIEFSTLFTKQRSAAPLEIKEAFRETLALYLYDPHHAALRNHALQGKFAGYRSIDVTDDWRAVFREEQAGERNVIKFYQIGTHTDLYE
jgi:addiction module RelE/StbE family toxin